MRANLSNFIIVSLFIVPTLAATLRKTDETVSDEFDGSHKRFWRQSENVSKGFFHSKKNKLNRLPRAIFSSSAGSHNLNVTPCLAKTAIIQPFYGTSLNEKDLVQIVQIPPVFTQNVEKATCVSQRDGTDAKDTAPFFNCRQRYSAVELYVARNSAINIPTNVTDRLAMNTKDGINFHREMVYVESGCEFSFNIFPFLQQSNRSLHEEHSELQQDYFYSNFVLKSPYLSYTESPAHVQQGESNRNLGSNTTYNRGEETDYHWDQNQQGENTSRKSGSNIFGTNEGTDKHVSNHQNYFEYAIPSTSNISSQQFPNHSETNSTQSSIRNSEESGSLDAGQHNNSIYSDGSLLKGRHGGEKNRFPYQYHTQGSRKNTTQTTKPFRDNKGSTRNDSSSIELKSRDLLKPSSESGNTSSESNYTKQKSSESKPIITSGTDKAKLYNVPNQIGMPVFILSKSLNPINRLHKLV